jgi:hypothetical protein
MSVEDNLSNSAIARELCIGPRTVANLLREATEEARQDTNLIFQKTLKARTNLLENLGKTLEKEGVSPHARARREQHFGFDRLAHRHQGTNKLSGCFIGSHQIALTMRATRSYEYRSPGALFPFPLQGTGSHEEGSDRK